MSINKAAIDDVIVAIAVCAISPPSSPWWLDVVLQ